MMHGAIQSFRKKRSKASDALGESLDKKAVALEPYLSAEGKSSVLASWHNDMVALTRVLKRQIGRFRRTANTDSGRAHSERRRIQARRARRKAQHCDHHGRAIQQGSLQ